MLNLNDLRLFVRAVEGGGFAAAARLTGTPKSTISKRVAELEAELGARLVHRSSRRFTLTEIGREFYAHACAALIEAAAAEDAVRRRIAEPSGTVRLTASVPVAQFQIAARLPDLLRRFPRIDLRVHVSDRFVDLVHEGFDIAVRSHAAPLPDSGLVQRRMAVEQVILVAAPSLVEVYGMPQTLDELSVREVIYGSLTAGAWRLRNARTGEDLSVAPPARLRVDEAGMLLQATRAGLGFALLPDSVAGPQIDAGALLRVLPEWHGGTITTTLLVPHRRGQLPATRAVVDFLAETGRSDIVPPGSAATRG